MSCYRTRSKYGVAIDAKGKEDRTADGVVFDSRHEMLEYGKLKALERCGVITDLKLQVPFPIVVNGVMVCTWIADFTCRDLEQKLQVYDAKGMKTETYKLKSKLFHACYPQLRIVEL